MVQFLTTSQQILPYVVNLIPPKYWPLLCFLQKLLEITMHVKMKWQTASWLQEGQCIIACMADDLEVSFLPATVYLY